MGSEPLIFLFLGDASNRKNAGGRWSFPGVFELSPFKDWFYGSAQRNVRGDSQNQDALLAGKERVPNLLIKPCHF